MSNKVKAKQPYKNNKQRLKEQVQNCYRNLTREENDRKNMD